jgi:hypothetical protein
MAISAGRISPRPLLPRSPKVKYNLLNIKDTTGLKCLAPIYPEGMSGGKGKSSPALPRSFYMYRQPEKKKLQNPD